MKLANKFRTPRIVKRKARSKLWSVKPNKSYRRLIQQRQQQFDFFRLPTRETLTYAEAQKLVDIDVDGELHRLNICQPISVVQGNEENVDDICKSSLATDGAFGTSNRYVDGESVPVAKCKIVGTLSGISKEDYRCKPAYYRSKEITAEELDEEVEYDIDDQDVAWLKNMNELRRRSHLNQMSDDDFELIMDRLEKEAFKQVCAGNQAISSVTHTAQCAVCNDVEAQETNVLLTCDTCELRVHQDCYGVPYPPNGAWLCKKCLRSPNTDVDCCLCPNGGLSSSRDFLAASCRKTGASKINGLVNDSTKCSRTDNKCKSLMDEKKEGEVKTSVGAYKPTVDGRWVHVMCALCVPDVQFISTVHLEPVDVSRISAHRMAAMCVVCRRRGVGACLTCGVMGCRVAFHPTCAEAGGMYVKFERQPVNGSRMNIRRTFYCNAHKPVSEALTVEKTACKLVDESKTVENTPEKCRRGAKRSCVGTPVRPVNPASKRSCVGTPVRPVNPASKRSCLGTPVRPVNPASKDGEKSEPEQNVVEKVVPPAVHMSEKWLLRLSDDLSVRDKKRAVGYVYNYWLLKKAERSQVPLIQRLYHAQQILLRQAGGGGGLGGGREEVDEKGLSLLKRIRQNMEKVRLLLELTRKREKLKYELIKSHETSTMLRLRPLHALLHQTLEKIQAKDTCDVFAAPVDTVEIHDYLSLIKRPMDFGTMKEKIDGFKYKSVADLGEDFNLVMNNCFTYNAPGSALHTYALTLQKQGSEILQCASRMCDSVAYCSNTALHVNDPVRDSAENPTVSSSLTSVKKSESRPNVSHESRPNDSQHESQCNDSQTESHESLEQHLVSLENRLKALRCAAKPQFNNSQIRNVHKEISQCKRRITLRQQESSKQSCHNGGESQASTWLPPLFKLKKDSEDSREDVVFKRSGSSEVSVTDSEESKYEMCLTGDEEMDVKPSDEMIVENGCTDRSVMDRENLRSSLVSRCNGTKSSLSVVEMVKQCGRASRLTTNQRKVNGVVIGTAQELLTETRDVVRSRLAPLIKRLVGQQVKHSSLIGRVISRSSTCNSENESSLESVSSCGVSSDYFITARVETRRSLHDSVDSMDVINSKTSSSSVSSSSCDGSLQNWSDDNLIRNPLPFDVVWAKTKGYPWYPAMIIPSGNVEGVRGGLRLGMLDLAPPAHILALRHKFTDPVYLIRFFDKRRNWQWLKRDSLEPLGVDNSIDNSKIAAIKSGKRNDIRRAYREAILNHKSRNGFNLRSASISVVAS